MDEEEVVGLLWVINNLKGIGATLKKQHKAVLQFSSDEFPFKSGQHKL